MNSGPPCCGPEFFLFQISLVQQTLWKSGLQPCIGCHVVESGTDAGGRGLPALIVRHRSGKPAVRRSLFDRLEFHYTPKHGSWIDMAEIELSALFRQCLADRIGQMSHADPSNQL
jgi:hypothetical protein